MCERLIISILSCSYIETEISDNVIGVKLSKNEQVWSVLYPFAICQAPKSGVVSHKEEFCELCRHLHSGKGKVQTEVFLLYFLTLGITEALWSLSWSILSIWSLKSIHLWQQPNETQTSTRQKAFVWGSYELRIRIIPDTSCRRRDSFCLSSLIVFECPLKRNLRWPHLELSRTPRYASTPCNPKPWLMITVLNPCKRRKSLSGAIFNYLKRRKFVRERLLCLNKREHPQQRSHVPVCSVNFPRGQVYVKSHTRHHHSDLCWHNGKHVERKFDICRHSKFS